MDENILREAVELAATSSVRHWMVLDDWLSEGSKRISEWKTDEEEIFPLEIAALASQLKSQVDAIEDYSVEEFHDRSAVVRHMSVSGEYVEVETEKFGPNRDENSIIACTEFLRGLK